MFQGMVTMTSNHWPGVLPFPSGKLSSVNPAAQQDVEGVLRCHFEGLAGDGQLDDRRVKVREGRCDRVDAGRPRRRDIREA